MPQLWADANLLDRYWPLIAAAGATTWLMLRLRGVRRTTATTAGEVRSAPTTANRSTSATTNARASSPERWEAELHDFAREVEGRLDNKMIALKQLIEAADRRIEHLASLGLDEPAAAPPAVPIESESSSPSANVARPHFADSPARHAAVYAMADAGHHAATIANRLGTPIGEIELILSLRPR